MSASSSERRFAPVLRYLVETPHGYVHPSQTGFTAGQTAWADPCLQFDLYRDANAYAERFPGAVVLKLRVRATLEPVKRGDPKPST